MSDRPGSPGRRRYPIIASYVRSAVSVNTLLDSKETFKYLNSEVYERIAETFEGIEIATELNDPPYRQAWSNHIPAHLFNGGSKC